MTQSSTNNNPIVRMPALFIGHGNPMLAITSNPYREAWQALGASLPQPKAILCISAHWQTVGTQVCVSKHPKTLHDFGGFPTELFEQQYAAPGAPEFAMLTQSLFPAGKINTSVDWGLDHGAWCILQSLFPKVDVPVFQLSLDLNLDFRTHFILARELSQLRQRGVLVIGSGNIVHNLAQLNMQGITADWARDFDQYVKSALENGDDEALMHIERAGPCARIAVPSDEHYLPLLYIAAVRHSGDQLHFMTESFDLGTLSMRSVLYS